MPATVDRKDDRAAIHWLDDTGLSLMKRAWNSRSSSDRSASLGSRQVPPHLQPYFIKELGPNFSASRRDDMVVDEPQGPPWAAKRDELRQAMTAASDLAPALREDLTGAPSPAISARPASRDEGRTLRLQRIPGAVRRARREMCGHGQTAYRPRGRLPRRA